MPPSCANGQNKEIINQFPTFTGLVQNLKKNFKNNIEFHAYFGLQKCVKAKSFHKTYLKLT